MSSGSQGGSGARRELVETNVSWVGRIPRHWRLVPARYVLKLAKDPVGDASEDWQLLSLTKNGVVPRDIESGEGKYPASFDTYQSVQPGDLIFCLFDIDETPRTVGLVHEPGMITGAYARFVVRRNLADPRFLAWYFIGIDDAKRFRPLYTGLRKVIQTSRFLSAALPLPSLSEQVAIADFLDRETAKIDALIDKQSALINRLRERRRVGVETLVRGLDAYPHVRLKYLYRQSSGRNPGGETILSVYRDYGVIPKASRADNTNVTPENTDRYQLVEKYDLVVNKMKAWQGSLGVSAYRGVVSPDYEVLRPTFPGVSPSFAHLVLRSPQYAREFAVRSVGIRPAQWRLYWNQLGQVLFPIPPIEVQLGLVAVAESRLGQTDRLTSEVERSICLAQERRSTLITAAVTGRLDVSTGKVA